MYLWVQNSRKHIGYAICPQAIVECSHAYRHRSRSREADHRQSTIDGLFEPSFVTSTDEMVAVSLLRLTFTAGAHDRTSKSGPISEDKFPAEFRGGPLRNILHSTMSGSIEHMLMFIFIVDWGSHRSTTQEHCGNDFRLLQVWNYCRCS